MTRVNDFTVTPIPIKSNHDTYKGSSVFPIRYSNIAIVSRKNSGKSTLIASILDRIVDTDDRVGIFSPTHDKDAVYEHIKKNLEKKNVAMFVSNDIIDAETGESLVSKFMDIDKKDDEQYIHVFDDLGTAMRHPSIDHYLKTNRHHHTKNLISVQSATDLTPSGWRQIDYCILLGGLPLDKLEKIHRQMTICVDFPRLMEIYNQACVEKYDFLCIDIPGNRFLKNLNTVIA